MLKKCPFLAHLILFSSYLSLCDLKTAQAPIPPSLSGWDPEHEEEDAVGMWQTTERRAGGKQLSTALDKILLSFLPSFLPTSPLFSSKHLQSGEPLAHGLTRWDVAEASVEAGCFLTAAAWVMCLLDKWDHWPGGPVIVFPETLLSSGCHLQGLARAGREEPSLETLPCTASLLFPQPPPAAWPARLPMRYTQSLGRRRLVLMDAALPPRCQKFFHSLGEGL